MQSENQQRIGLELVGSSDGADPFAAAVRTTRMPMIITDPRQDDNPIVFCNDAFVNLTGYRREETLGRNCRFLQGPGTNAEDIAKVRASVRTCVPIEIDLLNYKKSGETFWNRLLVSPVFENREPTYFFASQYDVTPQRERLSRMEMDQVTLETEVRRRIRDLTRSEERLSFTLRAGRLGSWTLELPYERLVVTSICKENFGRAATDRFTFGDLMNAVEAADRKRLREAIDDALRHKRDFDIDCRITTPDGELRWVELRGQPSFDGDGGTARLAGISLDVTERKRAEEHRLLLVRELNHRVKNTLATVQSIVRQSLRSSKSVEEAANAADSRIRALSLAHDILTEENWSGASMIELVAHSLSPFMDENQKRILTSGHPLRLKPRAALAMSMALHELATNASKYGSLSTETGKVELRWSIARSADGEEMLHFRWEESDGPTVEAPARVGFGSRLIERALASEIGGDATLEYRPEGLVFVMNAPLAGLVGARDGEVLDQA